MINFPVSDWMPDAKIPSGPIQDKWSKYKLESKLINPNNKRKYTVLVVGSGLAGASAAATLAELGYNVKCFCYQDSPRRAHSIAAQGGINAAKNYQNDGDSVYRLFYDTVKGGDFRAVKPMSTVWRKSPPTSLTSVWPRAFPSAVNTAACWTTAPSAAPSSSEPSTHADRRASSYCWVPTRPWKRKWPRDTLKCSPAMK